MTIPSFLALCSFFTLFSLGSMIYFENKKNLLNRTFALGCFFTSLTIFVIFMVMQSHNPKEALFRVKFQFVQFFMMPFFLHYFLIFTKSLWLKSKFTYFLLYFPSLILAILHLTLVQIDPVKQWWGYTYSWQNNFAVLLRTIWLMVTTFLEVTLCLVYSVKATGKEKIQAKYLSVMFISLILSANLFYVIAGILKIRFPEEWLYIIVSLPSTLIVVQLMRRYKLFVINPTTAAESIISAMNESLILLDCNNTIVYLNQTALNLLGFTEMELLGNTVNLVLEDEVFQNKLAKAIVDNECIINHETIFITNKGEKKSVILSTSLLKKAKGKLDAVVIVARDISERKQAMQFLKESEEKYRLLIENAGAGIWIVDRSGNIEYMNIIALSMFGLKRNESTGKTLWDLFPKNLADDFLKGILDAIDSRKGVISEKSFPFQNQVRWFTVNLQLIPESNGRVSKVQIIANEITQLKQTEETLISQTKKLTKANIELQEFIFIASHDLQEPLNKIIDFSGHMKDSYFESLTEQGQDYLIRMQKALVRMQSLINALLMYFRVTTKEQNISVVDLSPIFKEIVSDLDSWLAQTGGAVEISSLPAVEGDPVLIRELFYNLVENALKFHRSDIPPLVRISGCVNNSNGVSQIEITVADNGIGMEEKYLERIFGIFQRLHGWNEYEGTGIGLAVCKKIVERQGGKITVESEPGVGSRFIIGIPVKPDLKEDKAIIK